VTGSYDRLAAALADRYRIERELGQGGMATVYLARDLKHDREVAIKVLKPELAAVLGAERFVTEIKTTAALQHPNILPLFDSGSADGFLYYVMPYVEGETLRGKLDRETQLGVEDSVKLVSEVADALQYAHDHGVVHRDIKPENILLHAGRPMVADFGIALAVSAAAGGRMTETGLSLGTPHYMSPEQATAEKHSTNRSDIYSLGAVLYEMLTGEPPHTGTSAQQIIMKIVTEDVAPVTKIRKTVPANVVAATAKALEKMPADRFDSAKAFADALANPAFRHGDEGGGAGGAADAAAPIRRWKVASYALGTVAVLAIAAFLAAILRPGAGGAAPRREIRFPVVLDSGVYLGGFPNALWGRPGAPSIALSPDGKLLVYAEWKADTSGIPVSVQLYRRPLGQERSEPIPGTDTAWIPFFSPDGRSIGFFVGDALKRIDVAGGNIQTIVQHVPLDGAVPGGASWGDDGSIVYATPDGIYRVAAGGGEPQLLLKVRDDSGSPRTPLGAYAEPQLLPGGHTLLYHHWEKDDPKTAEIVALDLRSRKTKILLDSAMHPLFVPPDHLLFMREGTLMAAAFDPGRVRIVGQPRILMEHVMQSLNMPNTEWDVGAGQVAVSRSGDLAWVAGGTYPELPVDLFVVTPDGHARVLDWGQSSHEFPRVSSRGGRVAYDAGPEEHWSLEVRDRSSGLTQRVVLGGYETWGAEWSPDGDSLLVGSDAGGGIQNVYKMAADGSGHAVQLAPSDHEQIPGSWSSRGVIAYLQDDEGSGHYHIWTLAPGAKPTRFVASDSDDMYATFSPDGRMLAYASSVTGPMQVYVRPYPGPGVATQVSPNGGGSPTWSRDGHHLYYVAADDKGRTAMMTVDVASENPFRVGHADILIDPWPYEVSNPIRGYDVMTDGSFIAARLKVPAGLHPKPGLEYLEMYKADTIHVIANFTSELGGKAP
jgi:eukaryotic-like serine/threonine-protein kinase